LGLPDAGRVTARALLASTAPFHCDINALGAESVKPSEHFRRVSAPVEMPAQ
jgi:hypothetical protein